MIVIVVTKHAVDLDHEVLGVVGSMEEAQAVVERFDHERPVDGFWADIWQVGGGQLDTRQLHPRRRYAHPKMSVPWDDGEVTVIARNPLFRRP